MAAVYGRGCAAAAAGCGAALPVTGVNTAWLVVAGVTLLLCGVAVLRMLPRGRRSV